MKLHHIVTVPPSLWFLNGQIQFMKDRGFTLKLSSNPDDRLFSVAKAQDVEAVGVAMARAISPLADVKSIVRLVRILRQDKPDILHTHTPKAGLVGVISGRLARVPVVIYHIRGLPYMGLTGNKRRLMMFTEKVACMLAHRVFCVSHSIADTAVRDGLVSAEKIKVFHRGSGNGVDSGGKYDPDRFSEQDRHAMREQIGLTQHDTVVLFVGRLATDKGLRELASAWLDVAPRNPSARLVVVGSQDSRDPAPGEVIEQLERDPSVILAGTRNDTPEFYSIADVVVLPTYREGFPNVLLEASSMGVPVVASRVPGCTDAVEDGVTGTLVTVKDGKSLGNALEELIRDPVKRAEYGANGRERIVADFDSKIIWQAIFDEYIDLAKKHGLDLSTVS